MCHCTGLPAVAIAMPVMCIVNFIISPLIGLLVTIGTPLVAIVIHVFNVIVLDFDSPKKKYVQRCLIVIGRERYIYIRVSA